MSERIWYEILVYSCCVILLLMYGMMYNSFLRLIPYTILLIALVGLTKGYYKKREENLLDIT